jgi:hypothetical protein
LIDPTGAIPSSTSLLFQAGEQEKYPLGPLGGDGGSGASGRAAPSGSGAGIAPAEITLSYQPGMYRQHFLRKEQTLQKLAQQGSLRVTSVVRNENVTKVFRRSIKRRVKRQYRNNPEFRDRILRRIEDELQADHAHELQLGGLDARQNLWLMHGYTNWYIGNRQIHPQIQHLDEGTIITRVNIVP